MIGSVLIINNKQQIIKVVNDKELNNALNCYLKLCEAFCYSDIWKDRDAIAKFHYDKKFGENESEILLLYKYVYDASILYRKILDGKCEIEDRHGDIHWIADKVWYATQRSDVLALTNDNVVSIDKTITDKLIRCFNLQYHTVDRTFLYHVSGEVWEALGGDI